jgi:hypothetical protein
MSTKNVGFCYPSQTIVWQSLGESTNKEAEGVMTFARYKGRKRKAPSTAIEVRPYFSEEPFSRLMHRKAIYTSSCQGDSLAVATEDTVACAEKLTLFKRSGSWHVMQHGVEQNPPGFFTPAVLGANAFVKKRVSAEEIQITAVLDCVFKAKGLPPFTTQFKGYVRSTLNTFDMYVERFGGNTLHAYLNARLCAKLPLELEPIITQVNIALRAAQKYAGCVHNDLHLENIMVEKRTDGDTMVVRSGAQLFSFEPTSAFVKLIDFGQAAIVHPSRKQTVATVYTAHVMRTVACADIAKFMISLVKWAMGKANASSGHANNWVNILGNKVTDDVFRVFEHLFDVKPTSASIAAYANSPNDNTEYFPGRVGASPDELLAKGSCARACLVSLPFGCSPISSEGTTQLASNNFVEREHDLWNDTIALNRYEAMIGGAARTVELLILPRLLIKRSQAVIETVFQRIIPNLGKKGILLKVPGAAPPGTRSTRRNPVELQVHQTDQYFRKRMAWEMLAMFQRGVRLYLTLYCAKDQSSTIQDLGNAISKLGDQIWVVGVSEDAVCRRTMKHVRLLILCVVAMTDDYEPFFTVFDVHGIFGIMTQNRRLAANRALYDKMRAQTSVARDWVRFGDARGGDGLFVDAETLTHNVVYGALSQTESDSMSYLFTLAAQPLFYGRVG